MNKQRFIKFLNIPGNLKDDLSDLQELQQNYPYAQAIHVLVALAHKQNNTNDAAKALNYAAMYVADRHNLKELVTTKKVFKEEPEEKAPENIIVQEETGAIKQPGILPEPEKPAESDHAEEKEVIEGSGKTKIWPEPDSGEAKKEKEEKEEKTGAAKAVVSEIGNKFRESLIQKLEKLQMAKEKLTSGLTSEEGEENTLVEKIAQSVKPKNEKKAEKQKKRKAAVKKDIKSKSSAKAAKETPEEDIIKEKDSEKIGKDPEKASEDVEQGKIKKQQELISKFIEVSPSIKAKANKPPIISADQEDLSIPSTSFKENLISENLADIMVSQGKDDKAIDIYKKLIWKFPQKKAYFAARIEELTKKKG